MTIQIQYTVYTVLYSPLYNAMERHFARSNQPIAETEDEMIPA